MTDSMRHCLIETAVRKAPVGSPVTATPCLDLNRIESLWSVWPAQLMSNAGVAESWELLKAVQPSTVCLWETAVASGNVCECPSQADWLVKPNISEERLEHDPAHNEHRHNAC